jgi:hypothetical protein
VASLVPPTVNLLASFSKARVTNYTNPKSGQSMNVGGQTVSVSSLNPSNVPVVVPSGLSSAGNAFSVSAGVSP